MEYSKAEEGRNVNHSFLAVQCIVTTVYMEYSKAEEGRNVNHSFLAVQVFLLPTGTHKAEEGSGPFLL